MVTTTARVASGAAPAAPEQPAPPAPRPGAGPGPARPSRLRTLDGLRFLAAVGVLVYHFTARAPQWGRPAGEVFPVLGEVSVYFSLAPELFFVISGFVILWTAWGRSVPQVVASRVARLYPAYWAALALTAVLLLVVWPEGRRISLGQVAVNATLLQQAVGVKHVDGVYWTLWAELRFYLLVVLLVAVGMTTRRVLAFAAVWPVAAVAAVAAERGGVEPLATLLVGQYAPFFAGGMALFLLWRDGHAWRPWLVAVGNAALGTWAVVAGREGSIARLTVFEADGWLLVVASLGCFAAVAAATLTRLGRWDWRGLTAVGALTYPLYLVHEPFGRWTIELVQAHVPRFVALAAAVAVSVLLATLVHRFVERPVNRPLRRAVERGLAAVTPGRRREPAPS